MFQLTSFLPLALQAASTLGAQAIEPDSNPLLLVNNLDDESVSIIDTELLTEVKRLRVEDRPWKIKCSADGNWAYVGHAGSFPAPTIVLKVDLNTLTVVDRLVVPSTNGILADIEISPDGLWLAVSSLESATVHLVDTFDFEIEHTLVLCPRCDGFNGPLFSTTWVVFHASGRYLWVLNDVDTELILIDVENGIELARLPSSRIPTDLRLYPGWNRLPVGNFRGGLFGPTVWEGISGTSWGSEELGDAPKDIEFGGPSRLMATTSLLFGGPANVMGVFDVWNQTYFERDAPEAWEHVEYTSATDEMWAIGNAGVVLFDWSDPTGLFTSLPVGGSFFLRPGFSQDESTFAVIEDDRVRLIDAVTRASLAVLPTGDNPRRVATQGNAKAEEQ